MKPITRLSYLASMAHDLVTFLHAHPVNPRVAFWVVRFAFVWLAKQGLQTR